MTNDNQAPGTQLQIWDCSSASWQNWTFYTDGTILCMAVAGGSTGHGAAIVVATCDGSAAERFTLNGAHDLVNLQASKCVDVTNKQTRDGTPLQLWSCAGSPNQKWGMG